MAHIYLPTMKTKESIENMFLKKMYSCSTFSSTPLIKEVLNRKDKITVFSTSKYIFKHYQTVPIFFERENKQLILLLFSPGLIRKTKRGRISCYKNAVKVSESFLVKGKKIEGVSTYLLDKKKQEKYEVSIAGLFRMATNIFSFLERKDAHGIFPFYFYFAFLNLLNYNRQELEFWHYSLKRKGERVLWFSQIKAKQFHCSLERIYCDATQEVEIRDEEPLHYLFVMRDKERRFTVFHFLFPVRVHFYYKKKDMTIITTIPKATTFYLVSFLGVRSFYSGGKGVFMSLKSVLNGSKIVEKIFSGIPNYMKSFFFLYKEIEKYREDFRRLHYKFEIAVKRLFIKI